MTFVNAIVSYLAGGSKRLALSALTMLWVLAFGSFSLRAQTPSFSATREIRVSYPFDNSTLTAGYMDNASAFAALDSLAAAGAFDGTETFEVVSYSSPEGNWNYNLALSGRRAESFRKYLTTKYPQLTGRVSVNPEAEAWHDLANAVKGDERLSESTRESILHIISSSATPDVKEARLKALPEYKALYSKYFRKFRYAYIKVAGVKAPVTEPAPSVPDTIKVYPKDTVSRPDVVVIALPVEQPVKTDTVIIERVDTVFVPAPVPVPVKKTPLPLNTVAALKTNLLYDAVTALNFEVEVPIANKYSIMVEDVFPWWETGNKYCFQMWEIGVEARYWFKPWERLGTEKLRGWFAGVYGMSSKYDFQYDTKLNYQGEYWSVGATAGYAMPIGRKKRINLEFSVSVGYLQTDYRHYQPTDSYDKLIRDKYNTGKVSYFGPTKAKVSLVVPLNFPYKPKNNTNNTSE